jgi:menaquinol-cytochrome c reductase cytochrome b subunit
MKLPSPPGLRRKPPTPGSSPAKNGAHANGANGATVQDPKEVKKVTKQRQREAFKEQALEVPIAMLGWLDERTGSTPFLRAFLFRKIPKGTNWYYTLGSATLFAFVNQAVTGVFLAMYYNPSTTQAYGSVHHIINDVFLGEFVRGMHKWGSTVMVVLVFLHMGRTFFFGAYKYPRELNWIIGVVLLILTMAMSFTGYLLPFDQRSFWATVVGVNINASGPILGPYLADFLRGGAEFGSTTLSRFYAIHMLLIPGLIAALIGAHLFLVAKLGTTAPPWLKAEKARELAEEEI